MQKKVIDIFSPKETKKELKPVFFTEKKIEKAKEKVIEPEKKKKNYFRNILISVVIFLILIIFSLQFVFLKVKVEIFPETDTLFFTEKIVVDSGVDRFNLSSKIIPGKIYETEKEISQKFNTTGKVMEESYAQGTIRVYNNSNNSQTLVANTRFQPALEKVIYFRSTKTIVVPAKGYVDVEVKADKAGEEYNIEATTFSVPGLVGLPQYYSIYAKSFAPMKGGSKNLVSQVTQEDLDLAQKQLLEKIFQQAKDNLERELGGDFVFLKEATKEEIIFVTSSVPVGTKQDDFELKGKIKLKMFGFKKSEMDLFIKEFIKTKIEPINKKLKEQTLKVEYTVFEVKENLNKITLDTKVSAEIYSNIDELSLKRALSNTTIKEGQVLLNNQEGIKKAKIKVFPFWLQKIPSKEDKINIKINID